MKSWKNVIGSLWIIALVVFLVACSADSGTEADEPAETDTEEATETEVVEEEADEEEVTLVYARGVDTSDANDLIIEAFEEKHPHITVEYREMPADTGASHDQYVTAFSAQSDEIDIFDADIIWPAEFAQANYALELDRFIEKDEIDMDMYFPGPVAAGNFGGKQWAMPKFSDAGVLYYRTDIVEEPPATWDELVEQAGTLQGEEGTKFGYLMQAAQYEGLVCNAIEYIESFGGQAIDADNNVVVNSPETIKGIEMMQDIARSDFVPDNILNFMETETEAAFIEGNAVFARNWPYLQASANDADKSKVVDKVGFTTLPAGDVGSASTLGGWMTMINRYSAHPEAAWEFVKFMTGPEGQKLTAIHGGSPPTIASLYDDPEVQESGVLFADPEFVKVLESAVPRPVSPIYPVISDIMQIELSKALTGDQTAEETAENMQAQIEDVMNE